MTCRTLFLLPLLLILVAPAVSAQVVWVEFNPGTCQVGPPPNCVAGHWHPVYIPSRSGAAALPQVRSGAMMPLPAHTTSDKSAAAGARTPPPNAPPPGEGSSGNAQAGDTSGGGGNNDAPPADTRAAEEEEQEETSFTKISEISAQVEYESFTIDGGSSQNITGQAGGLRMGYLRMRASGMAYGVYGSYERSWFGDGNDRAPTIIAGNLFASQPINQWLPSSVASQSILTQSVVVLSGGLGFSSYNGGPGVDALTTVSPFLSMNMVWFGDPRLDVGGGLTYAYARTSFGQVLDESQGTLSLALNGGYRLGSSYYVAAEVFRIRGGLFVVGASATRFFSDSFGLTLGAKKLLGFDGYSNAKLTLGSSTRF